MDDIAEALYAHMQEARDDPDAIFCEQCGEPIMLGDPGHWWKVKSSKYPEPVTPALHDGNCRKEWFMEQPTISWYIKDSEIHWRN